MREFEEQGIRRRAARRIVQTLLRLSDSSYNPMYEVEDSDPYEPIEILFLIADWIWPLMFGTLTLAAFLLERKSDSARRADSGGGAPK